MRRWFLQIDYSVCRYLCMLFGRWENKLWRRLWVGVNYRDKNGKWIVKKR